MAKFLHLADIHLGFDRYESAERTKDFFLALQDALEKYAIQEQVDFVIIAGDLFEHRQILPATLNQAQACFEMLNEAGIVAIAIEGNHDNQPYGTRTSWLRYLADWGKLILLEPNEADEENIYDLWNPETRTGGYIDLDCGVRVLGSRWYGSTAPQAIQRLAAGIKNLPLNQPNVMIFHQGLEGQIARYTGALRYQDLLPLREAGVDYLALGHIHKNYVVEGWIFNPGSLEANSIAEGQDQITRGVYLVEIDSTGGIKAELKQDYYQRPIVRLKLDVNKQMTLAEIEDAAKQLIQKAVKTNQLQDAIAELTITGQLGFNRLDLNIRELRSQLHQISKSLIFLIKYDAIGTEYESPISSAEQAPSRRDIESQVFEDLLVANTYYSQKAPELAKALINLKEQILNDEPVQDLYEFTQGLL